MAEFLTPEQLQEFREVFNSLDSDGDEKIDSTELTMVLKCFGMNPTDAEIQDIINEVDLDGNGTLDFEEFAQLMCK